MIINKKVSNNFDRPAKPKFVLRRTKMSKSDVKSLGEFLDSSVVRKMNAFYNFALTIDSYMFLNISIKRADHLQTMEVVNFNPTAERAAVEGARVLREGVCHKSATTQERLPKLAAVNG